MPTSFPTQAQFLKQRGFKTEKPEQILYRMFYECWTEPGFHRFWRLWNPFFGWILFILYLRIGGKRKSAGATLIVFAASGFMIHDLAVIIIFHRPFLLFTIAFSFFGLAVIANRKLEVHLHQDSWPKTLNLLVNVILICTGFTMGWIGQKSLHYLNR